MTAGQKEVELKEKAHIRRGNKRRVEKKGRIRKRGDKSHSMQ